MRQSINQLDENFFIIIKQKHSNQRTSAFQMQDSTTEASNTNPNPRNRDQIISLYMDNEEIYSEQTKFVFPHQQGLEEEHTSKIQFNINTGDFEKSVKEQTYAFNTFVDERELQDQLFLKEEQQLMLVKKKKKIKKEAIECKTLGGPRKSYYERIHLKGQRRRKGDKNRLQQSVKGYWTKNLLPFAKNHHINFIENSEQAGLLEDNMVLHEIKNKKSITMQDYAAMYVMPQLQGVWKDFFSQKILFRQLMLSRTQASYRIIYLRFLHKFQDAFKQRKFLGISRIITETQNSEY